MPYTPILGTLGYVFNEDRSRVLLIHRNKRSDDAHFGKYNGLGGKMEAGEDVVACMKREIREEAGIECEELELRGTVSWPGFGQQGEDWFGFLFRITKFSGNTLTENPEGTLIWVNVDEVEALNLWEGDRHFVKMMFDEHGPQFHGVMPYRDGKPVSWCCSTI